MKKLGIICGSLSRGGAERVTIHLAEYMNSRGIDTDILTVDKAKDEYTTTARRILLNSHSLKAHALLNSISRVLRLPLAIYKLRKYIKNNNYDIILVMGVTNAIIAIPASRFLSVKTVISERNSPEHFDGKWITKVLARFLMKYGDGFVFQTEDAMNFHAKRIHNEGIVIYNPLFIKKYPERNANNREKRIVTMGRMAKQKNQRMLLQAFAQIRPWFPGYRLTIYGDGPLKADLKEFAKSLNMSDTVDFPGNVQDVHTRIVNATCFVLTSDFEGMPNALIEAMALGLPCISTDCPCGGPKCLIQNGSNGFLVPVGDSNSLADVLSMLLRDEILQDKLSSNAIHIREILGAKKIGKKWQDYLEYIYSL